MVKSGSPVVITHICRSTTRGVCVGDSLVPAGADDVWCKIGRTAVLVSGGSSGKLSNAVRRTSTGGLFWGLWLDLRERNMSVQAVVSLIEPGQEVEGKGLECTESAAPLVEAEGRNG